jgi:hypothetical protein
MVEERLNDESQQAEPDQQKNRQSPKDQRGYQDNRIKLVGRCEKESEQKNECDRCRPLLAQQSPEKEQNKQNRKRDEKHRAQV